MAKPEEAVLIHLLVFSPLHGEEMIGETIIDCLLGHLSQQNHLHMVEKGVPHRADFVFDSKENSKARIQ